MLQPRLQGEELRRYLETITAAVVAAFEPERVILFGSFARGEQNRASDLDLVIITETELPFCDRIGRALEACYRVSGRLAVEALVYTPAEWQAMRREGSSFARVVESEGRILHERTKRSPALAEASPARP